LFGDLQSGSTGGLQSRFASHLFASTLKDEECNHIEFDENCPEKLILMDGHSDVCFLVQAGMATRKKITYEPQMH